MSTSVLARKGLVQQMLQRPEPRLTTAQAAELLGLSRTTIVRWANAGALPCIRTPGGHRRFPLSGLRAWEKLNSSGAASPPEDDHADLDVDTDEDPAEEAPPDQAGGYDPR
jgi:MerR family transcriptional regulator, light-induced transcriptional regulator